MSKRIVPWITLLSLLLVFSSFPAIAASDTAQDAVSVSYSGCLSGESYLLLFLKDGAALSSFDAEDVLFMDQVTADGNGTVTALYVAPEFDVCQVCLAGVFADGGASPRRIEIYTREERASLYTPQALTSIEEEAFAGSAFTHVFLSDRVTSIGSRAFADCAALAYIEIPDTVTSIADDAFANSPHVVIACRSGSAGYRFAVSHNLDYQLLDA